jgi:hypothetical protein
MTRIEGRTDRKQMACNRLEKMKGRIAATLLVVWGEGSLAFLSLIYLILPLYIEMKSKPVLHFP